MGDVSALCGHHKLLNKVSFKVYHYLLGYGDHEIQSVDSGVFQLTEVTNV